MSGNTVAKIRAFNRFYTNILGLLNKGILDSPFSLSEVRLMLEIDKMEKCTLARLTGRLNIDKGLASRLAGRLVSAGLVAKECSKEDGRVEYLSLTEQGRGLMAGLNEKSDAQISAMIQNLSEADRARLIDSMGFITACLSQNADSLRIRAYRPEDVDYVVSRHRELYHKDYGFNAVFADYVGKTVTAFQSNRDSNKEQMWLAEWGGKPAGAVAIVRASDAVAQLRWFFVDPEARGRGVGGELIGTALAFCRERGYGSVILWTVDRMTSARRMYAERGFRLTESKPNCTWTDGELLEEKWELAL